MTRVKFLLACPSASSRLNKLHPDDEHDFIEGDTPLKWGKVLCDDMLDQACYCGKRVELVLWEERHLGKAEAQLAFLAFSESVAH